MLEVQCRIISLAEKNRIRRKPPQQMAAYDYVLVGRIHHHRVTREDNAEALRILETAIQLDPEFAEAYAWKACTLGQALEFGFCADFAETEKEAFTAIDKALSLDENDVECHRHLNVWGTKTLGARNVRWRILLRKLAISIIADVAYARPAWSR